MPRLIDLTHPLTHGQLTYPGDPPVRFEAHGAFSQQHYHLTRLSLGTHQGTHVDAPRHFFATGRSIDRIDLERFCGRATLIDLAGGGVLPPGTPLTLELLRPHAAAFAAGARVIYRTGWECYFGKARFFEDYPSLTLEAARWIASRKIRLLGMDTPGPSTDAQRVHRVLLQPRRGVVLIESLANLTQLPPRFTLLAFPLKLVGLDGAPLRAVAQLD